MTASQNRREFLRTSAAGVVLPASSARAVDPKPINVVVWDERQPEQKQAYDNYLGNHLADHLGSRPGMSVKSVSMDDDEKGISPAILRSCDVLLWWGHKRQAEITPKMVVPIVERIKEGTLHLIALHSAHWATPFVEATYERTRMDVERLLRRDGTKLDVTFVDPPRRYTLPKTTDRLTPYADVRKFPDGTVQQCH